MMVFILSAENKRNVSLTAKSVESFASDWTVVPVEKHPGETISQVLYGYGHPFFLTLYAGDILQPSFATVLLECLQELQKNVAGLFIEPFSFHETFGNGWNMRNHPVIWRTEAVKEGIPPLFLRQGRMPFGQYVLMDILHQLNRQGWIWGRISGDCWTPVLNKQPAWKQTQTEWALVQPILAANSAAAAETGKPAVSVVISTYNNAAYLVWAVRSLLAQTVPCWELVIVDDGSADDTFSSLEPFRRDSRIRLMTNEQNRGKSFCLNQAMQVVNGEWMLELDADDWLVPHALETLLRAAKGVSEEVAVLYADHYEWSETHRSDLVYKGVRAAPSVFERERCLAEGIPLAPRMYRVQTLKQIGGWLLSDPFGGRLYEDFQILIRLSLNHLLVHLPQTLYHRRLRPASITHRHQEKYSCWVEWIKRFMPPES